jgi:hypothetical protein
MPRRLQIETLLPLTGCADTLIRNIFQEDETDSGGPYLILGADRVCYISDGCIFGRVGGNSLAVLTFSGF